MARYKRLISKFSADGGFVKGDMFSAKKSAFSHEDVDYEDEYKGLGDRAVKDRVVPLLVAMDYERNTGFDGCVNRVLD